MFSDLQIYYNFSNSKHQEQQHPGSVTSGKQLRHVQVIRESMVWANPAYSISPTDLHG